MSDQTRDQDPQGPQPEHRASAEDGTNRRRFIKGGAAVAPVLMTLVSRPVLGQDCLSPSAFFSGNVSAPNAGAQPCAGLAPDKWEQTTKRTLDGQYLATTKFHSDETGFTGTQFKKKSLLDVLETNDIDSKTNVGRHVAAAFLNAKKGLNSTPNMTVVKGIWNEYSNKGYYEPTAGVKWYPDDIVAYLKSTQPG